MNSDELIEQMKKDELQDATKLSPREFAQLRGISPQLVYYHIRQKHLEIEHCICGRKVIDVATANAYFDELKDAKKSV